MFSKDIQRDIEEIKNLEKDMEEYNKCGSELGKKRFLLKMTKSNLEMIERHEKSDKRDSTTLVCVGLVAILTYLITSDDIRMSIHIICLSMVIVTLNNTVRDRINSKNKHINDLTKLGIVVKELEAEIRELEDRGVQE